MILLFSEKCNRHPLKTRGDKRLKCDLCGKTPQFGHNVSHSKRRTNRRWTPNVHPATIYINGQAKRLNLCTRCLRTQTKAA